MKSACMAGLGSGGLDLGKIAGPRDNYEKLRIFEYNKDSERKYSLRITEAFSESGYFWGGGYLGIMCSSANQLPEVQSGTRPYLLAIMMHVIQKWGDYTRNEHQRLASIIKVLEQSIT